MRIRNNVCKVLPQTICISSMFKDGSCYYLELWDVLSIMGAPCCPRCPLLLSKGERWLSHQHDTQHFMTAIDETKTPGSHSASPWSLPLALGSFKTELPCMNKLWESEVASLSQRVLTAVRFSNRLPEVCCEGQGHRLF